ncbi:MAG: ABC transporter permease [Chloroflexi bacterium]|nr:ABC transporter permease [Chloroflexota bacterium]
MGDLAQGISHSLVRMASFTGKELREVVRRPGVLASLILGPFLVMFLFGLGYSGYRAPFATEIVVPADSDFSRTAEDYESLAPGRLEITQVGEDRDAAEQRLGDGDIDLLVIVPDNSAEELRAGNQTTIRVAWNQVDPVYDQLATLATSILVSSLNAEIIERTAAAGITLAEGELGPEVRDISPEVIARPTTAETENVAPTAPQVLNFFGPAVFALVIQHLAITLTALSMVRERLSGQMDRFRVAPVTSMELLVGKYIAYAVLSMAVSAIVGVLLVGVLGVPLLGSVALFIGIVMLLTFASLGFGLLISLVADSERQAVQLSMLILLASVFFSGFVLPVTDFAEWMQYIAYALPVTHGIAALQELMLRGRVVDVWMLGVLLGIGVVLYVGSLLRLRRVLRTAD